MSHDAHVVMLLPVVIKQISMVGNLDGTSEYFALCQARQQERTGVVNYSSQVT